MATVDERAPARANDPIVVARAPRPGIPTARAVTLPSGRTVGYYEYGDPDGFPVFAFHGVPASGAGFVWADHAARARGIRLVAPDRPGTGRSDRGALARVADYPPHVLEFADAFRFDRFAVLGYSGGGPYACAVAYAAPERVRAAVVAAGAGNVGVWAHLADSEPTDRMLMQLSLSTPRIARAVLRAAGAVARRAPNVALAMFRATLPQSDRAVLATFPSAGAALALFTEAFGAHDAVGLVDDYATLSRPWGFAVEAIEVPLHVFHGGDDTVVPLAHARALAARAPRATLTVWPGASHFGVVSHAGEVLDTLLDGRDGRDGCDGSDGARPAARRRTRLPHALSARSTTTRMSSP
jgi:pimeloyl-ACP methyl ester carboxylesterase